MGERAKQQVASAASFDPAVFLASAGLGRRIIKLKAKNVFFSQGSSAGATGAEYQLFVLFPNNILAQSNQLAQIQVAGYIPFFELDSQRRTRNDDWYQQTRLFEVAYQQPISERLLQLPQNELTSAVAKFILFKTRTDRRMREKLEPVAGKALTPEDAQDLAADMIAVAKFYDIPLDMMLGIGAMENNYLDVRGDLNPLFGRSMRSVETSS